MHISLSGFFFEGSESAVVLKCANWGRILGEKEHFLVEYSSAFRIISAYHFQTTCYPITKVKLALLTSHICFILSTIGHSFQAEWNIINEKPKRITSLVCASPHCTETT